MAFSVGKLESHAPKQACPLPVVECAAPTESANPNPIVRHFRCRPTRLDRLERVLLPGHFAGVVAECARIMLEFVRDLLHGRGARLLEIRRIVSGCAVTRPELRIAPAGSSINTRRLLVTDARSIGVWSAFKVQSSYSPGSLFHRTNPAWVVRRALSLGSGGQSIPQLRRCARKSHCGDAEGTGVSHTLRAALRWEIHAAQEVLEARVGAQGVPHREYFQLNHRPVVLLVGLLQAHESIILMTSPLETSPAGK
jgi:hypothetical protein